VELLRFVDGLLGGCLADAGFGFGLFAGDAFSFLEFALQALPFEALLLGALASYLSLGVVEGLAQVGILRILLKGGAKLLN